MIKPLNQQKTIKKNGWVSYLQKVAKEPPKKKMVGDNLHLIIHILHSSVPNIYGRLIFIALASEVVWLPKFAAWLGSSSKGEWPSRRSWVDEPQHRSGWSC